MRVVYIANDGEQFTSAVDCANHEKIAGKVRADNGCRCYNTYLEVITKDVNEVLNEKEENKLLYIYITDRDRLLAHLRTEMTVPEIEEFYNLLIMDDREELYTYDVDNNMWFSVHNELVSLQNEIDLYKQDMNRIINER